MEAPLARKTIAVPETRDLEAFAAQLEALGATVIRCPLVGILDAHDAGPIECWLRELIDGTFHDVIFLTGEGLRRLMGFAQRAGIADPVREALAKARKITRGPKPAKALSELGLRPDLAASMPTTPGVIETLRPLDLSGRHVGVQLYGEDPNELLIDFLLDAGAHPEPVSPYIYAPAAHDESVKSLLAEMAAGRVDVLAFTSAPQVRRLAEIVEKFNLQELTAQAFAKTKIAAVGPVVMEELAKHGWRAAIAPKTSFIWKQLVKEIVEGMGKVQ
ncbi:MAG TPA: uroporphyrinogen-III synthase [Planctomycetota bacterium]|nr:uroporphyrinogen-III synthase [Planctomycetota bacterium]